MAKHRALPPRSLALSGELDSLTKRDRSGSRSVVQTKLLKSCDLFSHKQLILRKKEKLPVFVPSCRPRPHPAPAVVTPGAR